MLCAHEASCRVSCCRNRRTPVLVGLTQPPRFHPTASRRWSIPLAGHSLPRARSLRDSSHVKYRQSRHRSQATTCPKIRHPHAFPAYSGMNRKTERRRLSRRRIPPTRGDEPAQPGPSTAAVRFVINGFKHRNPRNPHRRYGIRPNHGPVLREWGQGQNVAFHHRGLLCDGLTSGCGAPSG